MAIIRGVTGEGRKADRTSSRALDDPLEGSGDRTKGLVHGLVSAWNKVMWAGA